MKEKNESGRGYYKTYHFLWKDNVGKVFFGIAWLCFQILSFFVIKQIHNILGAGVAAGL